MRCPLDSTSTLGFDSFLHHAACLSIRKVPFGPCPIIKSKNYPGWRGEPARACGTRICVLGHLIPRKLIPKASRSPALGFFLKFIHLKLANPLLTVTAQRTPPPNATRGQTDDDQHGRQQGLGDEETKIDGPLSRNNHQRLISMSHSDTIRRRSFISAAREGHGNAQHFQGVPEQRVVR